MPGDVGIHEHPAHWISNAVFILRRHIAAILVVDICRGMVMMVFLTRGWRVRDGPLGTATAPMSYVFTLARGGCHRIFLNEGVVSTTP